MIAYYSNRASSILYNYLKNQSFRKGSIILPANVCPIVPLTIQKAGFNCVFVDITLDTLQLDITECMKICDENDIIGVIVVATYGNYSYSYDIISSLKRINPNFFIIDDRCLCIPLDLANVHPDVDLVLYSTGYAKILDLGYGGIGISKRPLVPEELKYSKSDYLLLEQLYKSSFRTNSLLFDYEHLEWLDTSFLSDYDAEVLINKISSDLSSSLKHKEIINKVYDQYLPDSIKMDTSFNFWRYNVMIPNRQVVVEELFNKGFFCSTHYQPSSQLFTKNIFKHSEYLYSNIINLFNDFHINECQAKEICKIINNLL